MKRFGEIGADFSLQHSSRTQSAKISNKKVIAENQCEKKNNNKKTLEFSSAIISLRKRAHCLTLAVFLLACGS